MVIQWVIIIQIYGNTVGNNNTGIIMMGNNNIDVW